MEKIIPTISASTVGPLGVKHLPRLWQKTILSSYGRLPEGYKDIRPGFDYMALEGLKVDPDAAREFIFETKPTYPQFEAWIKTQPGVDLTTENIQRLNREISERRKSDDARKKILANCGLPDDGTIVDSAMLNFLDDMRELHEQLQGC